MTRLHDAKLGMYKLIYSFLTDNNSTITNFGASVLNTYRVELGAKIAAISNISELTATNTRGITLAKSEVEDYAINLACTVAGMLFSYGSDEGDTTLKEDMRLVNPSALKAMRDEEVIDILLQILYTAQENTTVTPPATNPLVPYGLKEDVVVGSEITEPGTLTELETAIGNYVDLTKAPRHAIAERKTQNKALKVVYKETDVLLTKMDKVVNGMRAVFTNFYTGYYYARILVGPMTLRTQIVGRVSKITDVQLQTTASVHGAKVTILAQPYTKIKDGQALQIVPEPVIVYTDENGKYAASARHFRTTYTVICSNVNGYGHQQQSEVRVKKGKKTRLKFLLEPLQIG